MRKIPGSHGESWSGSDDQHLDPVVVRGLEDMTLVVDHRNTIEAGYEKRDVVNILLALHDAGYDLPAEAIRSWALGCGWRPANANHLADYCKQIGSGTRPQLTGSRTLRPDLVDIWRDEVAERRAS